MGSYAQQWTWVKGTPTVNINGIYGTKNIPFGNNNPGSRNGTASWTDNSGNLWLFGGDGYASTGGGRLNDLWKYDITTNIWTWIRGSNLISQWGIYGTLGTTSSTIDPGARAYSISWKDASGNLWLSGGEGFDVNGSYGYMNDLWKFDVTTLQWTWMSGSNIINQLAVFGSQGLTNSSNMPGARTQGVGWADNTGNLWIFGGTGFASTGGANALNDLWKYNIALNQWTWMAGSNLTYAFATYGTLGTANAANNPGSRWGATSWRDNSNNLWLCSGYGNDGSTQGFLSDIWKFNPSSGLWTWMDGSNTINEALAGIAGITTATSTPGGRYYSNSWTDASANLYLYGGNSSVGNYNDLWRYNITTNNWTWLRGGLNSLPNYGTQGIVSSINDPGAGYLRTAWKDNSNNFWLFGGVGYDNQGSFSNLNELWKTSLAVSAPTASFAFNQTGNVCINSRITITDYSSNAPSAYDYYLDGVLVSNSANPILQAPNIATLTSGTHTVSLIVANSAGVSSSLTKTISISSLSATTISRTPSGTSVINVGSGQTNQSDWSPWVYNFTDPLPAGTSITRVDITYMGVDQAFGGTGAPGNIQFADQTIANAPFYHTWNSYSASVISSFPKYNYGGNNTLKLYFWGYPGWQGFLSNVVLTVYYERYDIRVCQGSTVSLTASGGITRLWSGGVIEGVAFTPTASGVYTVTSTDANACNNTNTVSITIDSPTISVYSGETCPGTSFTLIPTGASSYTYSGGTSIVSPTTTTTYSVIGTTSLGCIATNTAVVTVTVDPTPTLSVNSGYMCSGGIFTLTMSGAATYTTSAPSTTVSPPINTNYSVTGTSSKGCISNVAVSSVTVVAPPVLSVNSGSICPGNVFTISPSGASTYTYSSASNTVSPLSNSSYSVTGTDIYGCISSSAVISTVTIKPVPAISVSSGTICFGNSFTIVPSGAATYTVLSNPFVVSPLVNTSYSVSGTNSLGCISSVPGVLTVTVNPLPVINVNNGTTCAGSSFTITPTGASTYTFLSGAAVVNPTTSSSYSVVGTNSLGCVSSNTAVSSLTVNSLPLVSVNSGSLCSGNSFTLTPAGVSTYTFLSGASVVSPTTSSSYSVIGSSSFGCVSSNTAIASLTVNPSPNISINSGTICAGNSFNLVPSGANTYTFLNGAAVVSPTSTSSYSVIGASSLGCLSTNTAIASLLVNPQPVISISNGTICTGNSFTLTPSGASSYTYMNGTSVVTPTSSTSYSVIGTNAFGCLSANPGISSITVNSLPVLSINGPAAFCSGSTISETVTGANTYSWNTGSTGNVITISPTVSTLYSVTGTNTATGCFNSVSRIINIGYPPVINVNSGNVCAGNSFTMSPSGAATYTFSNGTNTVLSTVTPSANTSYFVSGTSSLGCVSTSSAISNVIVNASPVIVVNSGGVCAGKVFTMTPTGANTYTFSNGSSTVIPLTNSSYTVTGTNVLGCVSSVPGIANVTVNAVPVIAAPNGTVCSGSNYSIVPTGAYSYTYINSSGPTSPWVAPLVNTNYSITGISAQGCVSSAPAIITVSVISLPTISVNSNTVCSGSIFTITPTGASSYTFSSGASTVIPASNTSYSVSGTSSLGCVSLNAAVATVTLVATPFISVNSGVICAGKIFTMAPSGAATYTFSSLSATVAPLSNTAYIVTGTSSLGCVSSNAAISNVIVNPSPSLSIIGTSTLCNGESTTLIATGALTYSWSNNVSGPTQSVSPATSTAYTVSGSNSNGCVGSSSVLVVVNPLPIITLNTGTICPSGTFAIIPTGGITYTFSNGSNTVAPAVTTSYSVTGTGTNGCVSLIPAVTTITVLNTISLSVSGTTMLCIGSDATLSANGASTYTWSNGTFGNTIITTPTVNSVYMVVGADGSCSDTAFISVKVNPIPTLLTTLSSSFICSGENSTLSVSGANTYTWSGGETTTIIIVSPSVTTSYTITGVDVNGCSNRIMLTQNVNDCLGVKDHSEDFGLVVKLYPNPNSGEFIVEVPKLLKLKVLNALGQTIIEKQLIEGKNNIIMEDQAKGIYFIEFKNDEQIRTIRIIKQ